MIWTMMTTLRLAFCGLLTMAGAGEGPAGGDYGEPRLLVPAPDDPSMAHLSWPKIVATADGVLVLAYSAGKGHNIGGSGPAVSRSTDGGASFSPPRLLRRFPDDDPRYRDCGNLALGVAGDGAVVLLAMELEWQREGLVVSIPAAAENLADWSYPWTTPLGDRKWLLVFYAGTSRGSNAIYGMPWQPE